MNSIVGTVARKGDITSSTPQRYIKLRAAAEALSLRNADQAVIELFSEAIMRLVDLVYEVDSGGYCNIDRSTHRILIPLPWGRAGAAKWSIRAQESNIFRRIIFDKQFEPGLWLYDRSRRSWRVNLHDFPTRNLAIKYLTRYPIDIPSFRNARAKVMGDA